MPDTRKKSIGGYAFLGILYRLLIINQYRWFFMVFCFIRISVIGIFGLCMYAPVI